MAKDLSKSRIPRLDGVVSRIPLPSILRAQKPSKLARTTGFVHSQSSISQSSSEEGLFKHPGSLQSSSDVTPKHITRTMISGTPNEAHIESVNNETVTIHRTLARSETFIRDSIDDTPAKLMEMKQTDGFHSTIDISKTEQLQFMTRELIGDNTITLSKNSSNSGSSQFINNAANIHQRLLEISKNGLGSTFDLTKGFSSENLLCSSSDNLFDVTVNIDDSMIKMEGIRNSTMCNDVLLDITQTIEPARILMNVTHDLDTPQASVTQMLCTSMNDTYDLDKTLTPAKDKTVDTTLNMSVDEDEISKEEDMDVTYDQSEKTNSVPVVLDQTTNLSICFDPKNFNPTKRRFSFIGLDVNDATLDCSIDLCDYSMSSTSVTQPPPLISPNHLKKQNSFEFDESLGILSPDQMKDFLDSSSMTNANLNLPLNIPNSLQTKHLMHTCRIDQTPSPEDLPLDPIGVKTDITDIIMSGESQNSQPAAYQEHSQTDSDSKTDQMTKSATSKASNSFITSVTSITSLDTGYQGDGEMSRPASRGADHSPSIASRLHAQKQQSLGREPSFVQHNLLVQNPNQNIPVQRRPDPMTDSDFFTESDADDIFHRGDRRARVIDGQLYGPMLQGANIYINQQPQTDQDSCMESSGIFTDVENRGDEDLMQQRCTNNAPSTENDNDMSPDGSTDTIKSTNTEYNNQRQSLASPQSSHNNQQGQSMSDSTSTINSSPDNKSGTDHNNHSLINNASFRSIKTTINESSPDKLQTVEGKHSRKQTKNETNVALKKHEMSKRTSGRLKLVSESQADEPSSSPGEKKRPSSVACTRKLSTNKWDAVMNKIAENRTVIKAKNYSAVKSKVVSGVQQPQQQLPSPQQHQERRKFVKTSATGIGEQSTVAKRTPLAITKSTKRGRSYSKDSQQSSQSDLSLSAGSPKLTQKSASSARAAKKRDVRTISVSPSDLGPPPKTNTAALRNGTSLALQKRFSPPTLKSSSSPVSDAKSSPTAKKTISRKLAQTQALVKGPHKDHNRLINSTTPSPPPPKSTVSVRLHRRSTPPTSASPVLESSSPHQTLPQTIQKNGLIKPNSPRAQQNGNPKAPIKITDNNTEARAVAAKTNGTTINNAGIYQKSVPSIVACEQQQVAIAQQPLPTPEQTAQMLHASKGFEALGVLVQYLVYHIDAFSCPSVKRAHSSSQDELKNVRMQLNETIKSCQSLEQHSIEKAEEFSAREKCTEELHKQEVNKLESYLNELEQSAKLRVATLEAEIASKTKVEIDLKESESRNAELLDRISLLSVQGNELRDNALASESEFLERLRLAAERERELTEKVNSLNRYIETVKKQADNEKQELQEKLSLSMDEVCVLRNNSSSQTLYCKSESRTDVLEAESLRCVLELKQSEISELRKNNQELQRAADELPSAHVKISCLESRLEDLQIQLKSKIDEEKDLLGKNKQLNESYSEELKCRKRLSLKNEELQWKLKQNSEKYSLAVSELSKNCLEPTSLSFHTSRDSSMSQSEKYTASTSSCKLSHSDCFQDDDVSPPTSPKIKGVVEKGDSVSWVLEMDDEPLEAAASRMVKRAASFRLGSSEKNTPKRPLLHPTSNALTQSASATSVFRSNSTETPRHMPAVRTRSKSVNIKCDPKKLSRTNSTGSSRHVDAAESWKEPICSSSPKKNGRLRLDCGDAVPKARCRAASFSGESYMGQFNRPDNVFGHNLDNRGLITCDTAALISKRPELKNCQQIKEAAGEAMLSGTNSEDEVSIASSDYSSRVASSRSSSTNSFGRQQSIEEALNKIGSSLGGTPMEVSWSEDGDHFASESAV